MYYNNKFKVLNISLSIVIILTAIIGMINHNLKIFTPIALFLLGLQQLLLGVNSLKLNKIGYGLQIGTSIFLFLCSIISITLQYF